MRRLEARGTGILFFRRACTARLLTKRCWRLRRRAATGWNDEKGIEVDDESVRMSRLFLRLRRRTAEMERRDGRRSGRRYSTGASEGRRKSRRGGVVDLLGK